jgi:hypothetical protein
MLHGPKVGLTIWQLKMPLWELTDGAIAGPAVAVPKNTLAFHDLRRTNAESGRAGFPLPGLIRAL